MNRMSQGGAGHDLQAVRREARKGQIAAKHAAGSHVLQHRRHARLVDADQGHLPPLHNADWRPSGRM